MSDTKQAPLEPAKATGVSAMLEQLLGNTTPAEHPDIQYQDIPETLEEAEAQLEALVHKRAAAMDALAKL